MLHSHTLAARVSTAWTISRPPDLHVCVGTCAAGGGTTQTAAAHQLSQPLLTWHHNRNCHVRICRSSCDLWTHWHSCNIIQHRSSVVAWCRFSLPAYTQVTNFARFSATGMGSAYTQVYMVSFISISKPLNADFHMWSYVITWEILAGTLPQTAPASLWHYPRLLAAFKGLNRWDGRGGKGKGGKGKGGKERGEEAYFWVI